MILFKLTWKNDEKNVSLLALRRLGIRILRSRRNKREKKRKSEWCGNLPSPFLLFRVGLNTPNVIVRCILTATFAHDSACSFPTSIPSFFFFCRGAISQLISSRAEIPFLKTAFVPFFSFFWQNADGLDYISHKKSRKKRGIAAEWRRRLLPSKT